MISTGTQAVDGKKNCLIEFIYILIYKCQVNSTWLWLVGFYFYLLLFNVLYFCNLLLWSESLIVHVLTFRDGPYTCFRLHIVPDYLSPVPSITPISTHSTAYIHPTDDLPPNQILPHRISYRISTSFLTFSQPIIPPLFSRPPSLQGRLDCDGSAGGFPVSILGSLFFLPKTTP